MTEIRDNNGVNENFYEETEIPDEEAIRYISCKSPLDPSSMGFDDYLVNVYDDPHQLTVDTAAPVESKQDPVPGAYHDISAGRSSYRMLNVEL